MTKLIMISQPMGGKTDEEILKERSRIIEVLNDKGYYVIDTFFEGLLSDRIKHPPVYYLGKSLEKMAQVDAVYFAKDWEKYSGCRIEHETAKSYNLEILYE